MPDNIFNKLIVDALKRAPKNDAKTTLTNQAPKESEKNWVKSTGKLLNISAAEWAFANSVARKFPASADNLPMKFNRKIYQKVYPALKHSFVIVNSPQGPKCAFISRGKTDEGILGQGKNGIVKAIQWQDGSQDVIKIQSYSPNKNLELLNELDQHLGHFVQNRPVATPWVKSKGKVKNIKDKQYTILKKVEGVSLKDYLKNNKNSNKPSLDLALQCANAVRSLHSKHFIHTDIHPGNLMIDSKNHVTLIDFDSIQKLQGNQKEIRLKKAIGSRSYMAPEVGIWKENNKKGEWVQQQGRLSLASDVYSLARVFEKDLKLQTDPQINKLIKKMKSTEPGQRPDINQVIHELTEIKKKSAHKIEPHTHLAISVGQALLILIKHYEKTDKKYSGELKRLYMLGFSTPKDNQILAKIKKDPLLKGYDISDHYQTTADDASRRYFETHLSFETMKDAVKDYPLDLIQKHYDSIKSCFKDLGGDLDFQKFKKTKKRVIIRKYKEEVKQRAKNHMNPDDLIEGISREEQIEIDKIFSGEIPDVGNKNYNDAMFMEYTDMIKRIKESPYLTDLDKQKALLIVKTTRLSMILGNKMEKYKEKGTYKGELMPGEHIYKSDTYKPENRGRVARNHAKPVVNSHHMGLMLEGMPLDPKDEAYASRPFPYQKPSENSTFDPKARWVQSAMDKKVHTYSNSISGTLLVQLRTMIKLYKENKLAFKNKEDFIQHFRSMISIMTYMTGGHSLLEFSAPLQLKEVIDEFKSIADFRDVNLESLFYANNQRAFNCALEKTHNYNKKYMDLAKKQKEKSLPNVRKINQSAILNHFRLQSERSANDEGASVKPTDYSHLNPANVRQNTGLITLMQKVTGKSTMDLVIFKPERALLHEVAAYVTAFIKTDSENHRNEIIKSFVNQLASKADFRTALAKKYDTIRNEVALEIKKALSTGKASDNIYQLAINAASKQALPCAYCPEINNKEKLAIEIAAAQMFNQWQEKYLFEHVSNYFKANSSYHSKSKNQSPVVMFAAGGQGSGKGNIVANMLKTSENSGIDPKDFVYLNNDSYKNLLKTKSMNQKLFSQLTHDEARIIREKAYSLAKRHKMHLLLDQVSPSFNAANFANLSNGVVKGVFVSTQVETAIDRAFKRGKEIGRYEDTNTILECHQNSVNQALDYVMKNKGRKMHLDFFDNTKEPRLFLSIDCLNQTFQIHNHELLKEFIKKQCINVKAKKFDELYDKKATSDQQLEKLTNDWLSALMKAGFSNKDAKQTSKKKVKI